MSFNLPVECKSIACFDLIGKFCLYPGSSLMNILFKNSYICVYIRIYISVYACVYARV